MIPQRLSVDITSGTIFRIVLILIGFWFFYLILDILLMLFAAIIISAAVEPVANFLQRYQLPRTLSVTLVYAAFLLLLVGTVTLLVEPLTDQITQLAIATPQLIERALNAVAFIPQFNHEAVAASLQQGLFQVGQNLANISLNIVVQTRSIFSGIFTVLFVFVLAFYLVVEKDALKKFARLVTPRSHLPYVEQSIERAQRSIGRWVLAQ